jgi:hypothetical protein
LAAPASESARARAARGDHALICAPYTIFDRAAVDAGIARDLAGAADNKAIRAATVARLKTAIDSGRAAIEEAFAARPRAAREAHASYAFLTDGVVRTVLDIAMTRLHPRPNPTEGERIAVLAVGGYGRGEMAPFSDVDLLFLTPYKVTSWLESVIESMLYVFWDLHLKVGHSSRTIKECIRLGREDYTIRTALLERRLIAGEPALAEDLGAAPPEGALPEHRRRLCRGQARRTRRTPPQAGRPALHGRAQREGGQGRAPRPPDAVLDRQVRQGRRYGRGPRPERGCLLARRIRDVRTRREASSWRCAATCT